MSLLRAALALACAGTASAVVSLTGAVPMGAKSGVFGAAPVADGMNAWSTVDLTVSGFAPHQKAGEWLDVGAVTPPGSAVEVDASGSGAVLLYAFVYGCYPCPERSNGLVDHLLNVESGWRMARCAPRFTSARFNQDYRLMAFVKRVDAGETYTLSLPGYSEYTGFVATETFTDCAAETDAMGCASAGAGEATEACVWDNAAGTCEANFCARNAGPARSCTIPDACPISGTKYVFGIIP